MVVPERLVSVPAVAPANVAVVEAIAVEAFNAEAISAAASVITKFVLAPGTAKVNSSLTLYPLPPAVTVALVTALLASVLM